MVFNLKPLASISQLEYNSGFSFIPASEVHTQPPQQRPAERLCRRDAGTAEHTASSAASTAFKSLTRSSYRS